MRISSSNRSVRLPLDCHCRHVLSTEGGAICRQEGSLIQDHCIDSYCPGQHISLNLAIGALLTGSQAHGCCVVLIVIACIGQRSKTQTATKARAVALASATFDSDGRILVTSEGLLPCRKITNSDLERVSLSVHSSIFTADFSAADVQ